MQAPLTQAQATIHQDMAPTSPGLKDVLRWGAEQLRANGIDSHVLESRILLRHVLNFSDADLAGEKVAALSEKQIAEFGNLIARRQEREPIAYITGSREFMGLDFAVDRRVLIPRPETELLVEKVLELFGCSPVAGDRGDPEQSYGSPPLIADVGTGSGAIGVSIARHLPHATVFATDVSADALEVAQRNAATHGVANRMVFSQGAYLWALPKPMDVIVCNPPYIPESEIPRLDRDVRDYEPTIALSGGDDGLIAYRSMFPFLQVYLSPGGHAFFEIGFDMAASLRKLAWHLAPGARVHVYRDLAGFDRVMHLDY